MTNEWRLIIELVQKTSRQVSRIEVDALNTVLDHPNLPLVKVVVQTFSRVYRATAPKASQTLFEMIWTSAFDPGMGLRKRLLMAFRESDWPPAKLGDVALDAGIAEQIFRDLHAIDSRYFNLLANELRLAWANRPHLQKSLKVLDQLSR